MKAALSPATRFRGLVEAVTAFQVSNEVYGLPRFDRDGAWTEYAIVTPDRIALLPRSGSHEESAALSL